MHWALPDLCAIHQTTKGWAPAICRGDLFIESLFPEQAAREVNFTLASHIWWHIMPSQFVDPLCWKQTGQKNVCFYCKKTSPWTCKANRKGSVGCLECLDASMIFNASTSTNCLNQLEPISSAPACMSDHLPCSSSSEVLVLMRGWEMTRLLTWCETSHTNSYVCKYYINMMYNMYQ